jgi:general stress protein YciG
MHRVVTTDAEIDAAIARAREYEETDPRVERAEYQPGVDLIALYMRNGIIVAVPRELLQGLREATLAQLRKIEILGPGTGLDWPELDVQHSVEGLLRGVFGNRRWMAEIGRAGGLATSPRKTEAARRNGRKGGRPKSTPASQSEERVSTRG